MKSKRVIKLLVAVACAMVFCFALGACAGSGASGGSQGGGNQGGGGEAATFSGKWVACEVTDDGETVTYEQGDAELKTKMDNTWFDFKDDGTVQVSDGYPDATETTTWEATSPTTATIAFDDSALMLTIQGDRMTVATPKGTTVVMKKV